MKIAYIVSQFPCLSETFVLNQVTGLIDQGHSVDIYAQSASKADSKIHEDVIDYNLLDSTHYFNRPGQKHVATLKSLWLILVLSIRHPSFFKAILNYLRFKRSKGSLSFLKFVYAAAAFVGSSNYDVIHCHFGPNGVCGAAIKQAFLPDSVLATSFHGYDLTKYLLSKGSPYSFLFEVGDVFLPISEHWKESLTELGCDSEKIRVHHMGVDVKRFSVCRQPLQQEKVRILTIARLSEKKGIEYGIRAVGQLKSFCSDIEYFIVGEGPLREHLQATIDSLDLSENVKLLGWREQQEIVALLSQSQILLAPSVTSSSGDQEGIPVVLMEAMAMGLPVVSSWHSGIPELVEDGRSGFLLPEKAVDDIAKRLMMLVNSSELRSEMGDEGRKSVEEDFNISFLNYQLGELFESLRR